MGLALVETIPIQALCGSFESAVSDVMRDEGMIVHLHCQTLQECQNE